MTLEIIDLDSIRNKEDVEEALRRDLEGNTGDLKVTVSKASILGQVMAIVDINEKEGRKLLVARLIKVGWIYSRIRERIQVVRCFNCLSFDHQSRDCK